MIWSNSLFFIQDSVFPFLLHQFEGNSPHSFRALCLCLTGIREMDDDCFHGLSPGPFLPGRLTSAWAPILLLLLRGKGWKRGTVTLVFSGWNSTDILTSLTPPLLFFPPFGPSPFMCSGRDPLELAVFFVFISSVSPKSDGGRPVHSITISKNKKLRHALSLSGQAWPPCHLKRPETPGNTHVNVRKQCLKLI